MGWSLAVREYLNYYELRSVCIYPISLHRCQTARRLLCLGDNEPGGVVLGVVTGVSWGIIVIGDLIGVTMCIFEKKISYVSDLITEKRIFGWSDSVDETQDFYEYMYRVRHFRWD